VRRKTGTLIPIEQRILEAGLELNRQGESRFHGFLIAKRMQAKKMHEGAQANRLTGHGTLYKALDRLERAGLVSSTWEDPDEAATQKRPRRRLYQVTPKGSQALIEATSPRHQSISAARVTEAI
jgi:PadR family transcriptional regulator PadR